MNFETTLDTIKKYGATAVLVLWVLRQETRLNTLEDKLYNCYTTMSVLKAHRVVNKESKLIAIIPNDIYTKNHIQRYVKA